MKYYWERPTRTDIAIGIDDCYQRIKNIVIFIVKIGTENALDTRLDLIEYVNGIIIVNIVIRFVRFFSNPERIIYIYILYTCI